MNYNPQSKKQLKGGNGMFKRRKKTIDLSSLRTSKTDEVRIPTLFLQMQKFFFENEISEEDCKVLARMLNAYYDN